LGPESADEGPGNHAHRRNSNAHTENHSPDLGTTGTIRFAAGKFAKLKALNPGWEYHFFSDEAVAGYVAQNFPQYYPIYQSINPKYGAARSDLLRYLLLHREGGVYLDIKSTFTRPLDHMLDRFAYRLVESSSDLGFVYNHYYLASGKKHKELFEHHYSWLDEPNVLA